MTNANLLITHINDIFNSEHAKFIESSRHIKSFKELDELFNDINWDALLIGAKFSTNSLEKTFNESLIYQFFNIERHGYIKHITRSKNVFGQTNYRINIEFDPLGNQNIPTKLIFNISTSHNDQCILGTGMIDAYFSIIFSDNPEVKCLLEAFGKVVNEKSLPLVSRDSLDSLEFNTTGKTPCNYFGQYKLAEFIDLLTTYDFAVLTRVQLDELKHGLTASNVILGGNFNVLPLNKYLTAIDDTNEFASFKNCILRFCDTIGVCLDYNSLMSSCVRCFTRANNPQKKDAFGKIIIGNLTAEEIRRINWHCINNTRLKSPDIDNLKLSQRAFQYVIPQNINSELDFILSTSL
jgi:hypothetical protein